MGESSVIKRHFVFRVNNTQQAAEVLRAFFPYTGTLSEQCEIERIHKLVVFQSSHGCSVIIYPVYNQDRIQQVLYWTMTIEVPRHFPLIAQFYSIEGIRSGAKLEQVLISGVAFSVGEHVLVRMARLTQHRILFNDKVPYQGVLRYLLRLGIQGLPQGHNVSLEAKENDNTLRIYYADKTGMQVVQNAWLLYNHVWHAEYGLSRV